VNIVCVRKVEKSVTWDSYMGTSSGQALQNHSGLVELQLELWLTLAFSTGCHSLAWDGM